VTDPDVHDTRSEALRDAHGGAQHRPSLHARRRRGGLHDGARVHPGLQRAFGGEDLAERGHPLLQANHLGHSQTFLMLYR
jgi:hypothetical protein